MYTKYENHELNRETTATSAGTLAFGRRAREARIREAVDPSRVIPARAYNILIGAVLLWGLLINYLLCRNVGSYTRLFPEMNPAVFLIGYLAVVIGGIVMTNRANSPLVSFLGFNLVVVPFGIVISTIVEAYGGISSSVVTLAFLYTLLTAGAILATVIVFPNAFAKIGSALGAVLIGLIICEAVLLFLHVDQQAISWVAAGLFSLYLGYDIYRSQQYPKTVKNAVASAMDIYLDMANLFIRILQIMGRSRSSR